MRAPFAYSRGSLVGFGIAVVAMVVWIVFGG